MGPMWSQRRCMVLSNMRVSLPAGQRTPTRADLSTAYMTKLKLEWKTGVAATDWNSIAKKEHLDALTVELRKLEDNIREVYSEMLQLQQREQEMRNISGAGGRGGGVGRAFLWCAAPHCTPTTTNGTRVDVRIGMAGGECGATVWRLAEGLASCIVFHAPHAFAALRPCVCAIRPLIQIIRRLACCLDCTPCTAGICR